jgi:hypothetical protein
MAREAQHLKFKCVLCKQDIDPWKDRFFTVFTRGEVLGTINHGTRVDFHKHCFVTRRKK